MGNCCTTLHDPMILVYLAHWCFACLAGVAMTLSFVAAFTGCVLLIVNAVDAATCKSESCENVVADDANTAFVAASMAFCAAIVTSFMTYMLYCTCISEHVHREQELRRALLNERNRQRDVECAHIEARDTPTEESQRRCVLM